MNWIRAMALELCGWLYSLILAPWAFSKAFLRPVGASSGTPILLVHGYLHCGSVWAYFRQRLTKAGFGPIYTINLTPALGSIPDYAQQIHAKAEAIAKETGSAKLILIGHSMGGLACGWYATCVASPQKELTLISIGSPWDGTHLARFALGPNAKQMRIHSPFLRDLQHHLAQRPELLRYYIATPNDQIVLPWKSTLLGSHPERRAVIEGVGHLSLLYSTRATEQVCHWLNQFRTDCRES